MEWNGGRQMWMEFLPIAAPAYTVSPCAGASSRSSGSSYAQRRNIIVSPIGTWSAGVRSRSIVEDDPDISGSAANRCNRRRLKFAASRTVQENGIMSCKSSGMVQSISVSLPWPRCHSDRLRPGDRPRHRDTLLTVMHGIVHLHQLAEAGHHATYLPVCWQEMSIESAQHHPSGSSI